jgi:hypothetical protein
MGQFTVITANRKTAETDEFVEIVDEEVANLQVAAASVAQAYAPEQTSQDVVERNVFAL